PKDVSASIPKTPDTRQMCFIGGASTVANCFTNIILGARRTRAYVHSSIVAPPCMQGKRLGKLGPSTRRRRAPLDRFESVCVRLFSLPLGRPPGHRSVAGTPMTRYAYNIPLRPPAPFVRLALRHPRSGAELRDVPALL